jgi:hypothetical protein
MERFLAQVGLVWSHLKASHIELTPHRIQWLDHLLEPERQRFDWPLKERPIKPECASINTTNDLPKWGHT